MSKKALPRPRSDVCQESIVTNLNPICKEFGKSFCRYNQAKKCEDVDTDREGVIRNKDVIRALGPLPLTKLVVQKACEELIQKFKKDWKIKDEHAQDGVQTMTCRLFNVHHSWRQAMSKKSQWAQVDFENVIKAEPEGFQHRLRMVDLAFLGLGACAP